MIVLVYIHSSIVAWTIPESYVERLRSQFSHATFLHARSETEATRLIAEAEIAFMSECRRAMLAAARRLRWIHSPAAGVGNMLFPEMVASEVVITNSRGVHASPMAEHAIGVSIALRRKLPTAIRRQAQHEWAQNEMTAPPAIRLIRGARMGVVGLGAVGSEVAHAAAALGMHVSAVRKRPDLPAPAFIERVYPASQLLDLLRESDIVVLAAPLTPETREMIRSRELQTMKRDGILVNVSRGKLVSESALADALARGTIGGAALDVFEHEPLDPTSPLWDLPNVLITPHTAGLRHDYWDETVALFAKNLRRFAEGKPLLNPVDKKAGY